MQVHSDTLAELLATYQTRFGQDYNTSVETQSWKQIAQIVDSNSLYEKVPFSGAAPRVQDTTDGQVEYEDSAAYLIEVENREFQAGWEIKRAAFDDDRIGLWANKPSEMAEAVAEHPGEYIWGLIELNGNAYDGNPFYYASRSVGASATVNNILSGSGTDPVDLLYDLDLAQRRMFKFQTDKARAIKRMGNVITCSIDLFQAWFDALAVRTSTDTGEPTRAAPGEPTFQAGRYTVIVNPEATDSDNWQLHHVASTRKPFILTNRVAPKLEGTNNTSSHEWRNLKKAQYNTYARYGRGYADPRLSVLVSN